MELGGSSLARVGSVPHHVCDGVVVIVLCCMVLYYGVLGCSMVISVKLKSKLSLKWKEWRITDRFRSRRRRRTRPTIKP